MKNKLKSLLILALLCLTTITAFSADRFSQVKNRIDSAAVVRFEVLITIESKIFNDIDSLPGLIILAEDGRYRAELNNDIYFNDGITNWEYSAENNQVTKRELLEGEEIGNQLSFFKNLDSFYKTSIIEQGLIYKLIKIDGSDEALPDSLTVKLDKTESKIFKIEYFDINDDLNSVYMLKENYEDKIEEDLFIFDLPDSVEIITLP